MTLDTLIMLFGALVALVPFLGIPNTIDTWVLFILGIAVIGLGIAVRRRGLKSERSSTPPHFDEIRSE
jgi:hypothetical protein